MLKSLGPIDRKFHGHGENDGFVLYEYIIKQCSNFCKRYEKISNKIALFMGNLVSYLIVSDYFQVVKIHRRIEQSSIIRYLNCF